MTGLVVSKAGGGETARGSRPEISSSRAHLHEARRADEPLGRVRVAVKHEEQRRRHVLVALRHVDQESPEEQLTVVIIGARLLSAAVSDEEDEAQPSTNRFRPSCMKLMWCVPGGSDVGGHAATVAGSRHRATTTAAAMRPSSLAAISGSKSQI